MNNTKILDVDAMLHNLDQFKDKKICAMVKANAYGHGLKEIVGQIASRVHSFGVVSVEEAKEVRKLCDKPIIICSKVFDFRSCKKYGLEVMIENEEDARLCVSNGLFDSMHLKINCGMNRFGNSSPLALKILNGYLLEKNITLKSIYTHFPRTGSKHQVKACYKKFCQLKQEISQTPLLSFGGSEIYNFNLNYDILRLGIGLYGYGSGDLRPIMKINSTVLKVFYAHKGEFIGYGKEYKVPADGYFAIVGMGYADGFRRNLSGKTKVVINSRAYQVVGNICMDCFFIEADDRVAVGDEVCVLSNAQEQAKILKTIPYEVLTGFNNMRGKTILAKKT